jgi:hypothetical protein
VSRLVTHFDADALEAMARAAAADGLTLSAQHVLTESRRLVPIEEHTLEQSGAAEVDASALAGSVSYDTPYARRQHEDLSLRHDDGRRAKYLEVPSVGEADTVAQLMAQAARKVFD